MSETKSTLNIHDWTNIHAVASTDYRTSNLKKVRVDLEKANDETDLKNKKLVEYRELFKSYGAAGPVDHDSSILSPAAYFVDLMRLIEAKVTKGKQNHWGGLEDLKLQSRRPDLWEIELDAKNTTTEVPYLEIVNDVMKRHLMPNTEEKIAMGKLASGELNKTFYHAPLAQIRACLNHFGVSLTDIYKTVELCVTDQTSVSEILGLSPNEYEYLNLKVDNLSLVNDEAHVFKRKLLFDRMGWSSEELSTAILMINEGDDVRATWYDLKKLAQVKYFKDKYQLPVEVICCLVNDWIFESESSKPKQNEPNSLFNRIFNQPQFYPYEDSGVVTYGPCKEGLDPIVWDSVKTDNTNLGIRSGLLAALNVNNSELQAIVDHLGDIEGVDRLELKSIKLSTENLIRFYRLSKMARVLGLEMQEYLRLLKLLAAKGQDKGGLKLAEITNLEDLTTVDLWASWLKETGLNCHQLDFLIKPVKESEKKNNLFLNNTNNLDNKELYKFLKKPNNDTLSEKIRQLTLNGINDKDLSEILKHELAYQIQSANLLISDIKQDLPLLMSMAHYLNPNTEFTERPNIKVEELSVEELLLEKENQAANEFLKVKKLLQEGSFEKAASMIYLAKSLNLEVSTFDAVLQNLTLFGIEKSLSKVQFDLDSIHEMHAFNDTVQALLKQNEKSENIAIELAEIALSMNTETGEGVKIDYSKLQAISGWNFEQAEALHIQIMSSHIDAIKNSPILQLRSMNCAFDLAKKLGVDVRMLIQICTLYADNEFGNYDSTAKSLLHVIKSKYNETEWEKVYSPIRSHLSEKERDALTSILLEKLRKEAVVTSNFGGMDSLQDLSDYLLIDVEMSGVAEISKIKLALNTLQRYIQRCHMGLEGGGAITCPVGDKEWAWRSHYRLWEANRKVFLYPENYLEPGLRKIKTPLFRELEDELLQGDVTDESVTNAYIHYFDKLVELANLEIIDACSALVKNESMYFFIGKTKSNPPTYFYRSAKHDKVGDITAWNPWQKIALSIPADTVSCLFAKHSLHLFWVEEKEQSDRAQNSGAKTSITKATVMFSSHNVSGTWFPPQHISKFKDVIVDKDPKDTPEIEFPMPIPFLSGENDVKLVLSKNSSKKGADTKSIIKFLSPNEQKVLPIAQNLLPNATVEDAFMPFIPSADEISWGNWVLNKDTTEILSKQIALNIVTHRGDRVFYKTKEGRPCISYDGGSTWSQTTGFIKNANKEDPYDYSIRYTKSEDGIANPFIIGIIVFQNKVILATKNHGIYTSSNVEQFSSDTSITNKTTINSLTMSPDRNYLYLTTNEGVYRKKGDGQWEIKNIGLIDKNTCSLAFTPDGNTIFIGTFNGNIFQSNNKGDKWIQKNKTVFDDKWSIQGLAVGFLGTIFAGTSGAGVFSSTNNGETWKSMNEGLQGTNVKALGVSSDGHSIFALLSDKQIYELDFNDFILAKFASEDANSLLLTQATGKYRIYRIDAHPVQKLRENLITGGIDSLLSPDSQTIAESRLPIDRKVPPPLISKDLPSETLDFKLSSAYATYYREIFFHIPFLIADTLNRNQHFEESQKWYHYIFDPMSQQKGNSATQDSFWRYRPFQEHSLFSFEKIMEDKAELDIYNNDPFDPHAIAGSRPGAYEKAIVMKYIDNLLDWGDQLYAQDNWESIVQAMMLYTLSQGLLGKKSNLEKETYWLPEGENISTIKGISDIFEKDANTNITLSDPFDIVDIDYFKVAPNTNFAGYWSRVEDRLFKIRHSMNIKGIVRQMALFQPAIDPSQLIRALAAGGDLTSIANQLSPPVPHYRFSVMIQHAKNLTSTLSQLGSALLSALEKKDAEKLNLLRSNQEKATLNLTTKIKEKQIKDEEKSLDSLNASLGSASGRKEHYDSLISTGLITQERTSLSLTKNALKMHTAAHELRGAAVAAHLIPTVFGFADGSFQPGSSISEAATLLDTVGGMNSEQAGLATIQGQNERRKEDWALQLALATSDVTQITAQIEGAKIKLEISQKDLDMHQQSIAQAKEREELLRGKFSSHELYNWIVGQISTVYFQTYKMAFDMAKSAEKAYQYERNTDDTMITSGYWNSLKHGLMAGEGLMLSLNHLEKSYIDNNKRTLEIEKTISLLQLLECDSSELIEKLKGDDGCRFDLEENLFKADFPGHYCRKIKTIAITIPAVVGPYQNLPATLTQTRNSIKLKSGDDEKEATDWTKQQQIAISRAVNDSGLFELNFHDERYLPFEGTGVVSSWTLKMPGTYKNKGDILDTISDVIIHLKYTALDGGDTFK